MGIFEKIKHLLNRVLGKKNNSDIKALSISDPKIQNSELESIEALEFPENELVSSITDGVLDTNCEKAIATLKHNLEVLIKRTKEAGKVEKFIIIREDNFFPEGWQWDVLSSATNLESVCTPLSYELRQAYALRSANKGQEIAIDTFKIPQTRKIQENELMKKVDNKIGNFLLPSRFRSTKHFTINTPLEVTGNYNFVSTDRDYIIIDGIDEFLKSGYGYSVSYHDAYIDTAHESLPISENAVVLIKEDNYDRIMSDPKKAEQLSQRRVIKYTGETYMAINMILSEMGALPSQIGEKYAFYDSTLLNIIDTSIKKLASDNRLLFDKSHGGSGTNGHFTTYFDNKNQDYQDALNESTEFLIKKFSDKEQLFRKYLSDGSVAKEIIEQIGIDELLSSINEYNEIANVQHSQSLELHRQNRKSIPLRVHEQFTRMIYLLNIFYSKIPINSDFEGKDELEASIQKFFQAHTYQEQIEGLKNTWKNLRLLISKMQSNEFLGNNKTSDFEGSFKISDFEDSFIEFS